MGKAEAALKAHAGAGGGGYQILCDAISCEEVRRSHQEEFRERNEGKQPRNG